MVCLIIIIIIIIIIILIFFECRTCHGKINRTINFANKKVDSQSINQEILNHTLKVLNAKVLWGLCIVEGKELNCKLSSFLESYYMFFS